MRASGPSPLSARPPHRKVGQSLPYRALPTMGCSSIRQVKTPGSCRFFSILRKKPTPPGARSSLAKKTGTRVAAPICGPTKQCFYSINPLYRLGRVQAFYRNALSTAQLKEFWPLAGIKYSQTRSKHTKHVRGRRGFLDSLPASPIFSPGGCFVVVLGIFYSLLRSSYLQQRLRTGQFQDAAPPPSGLETKGKSSMTKISTALALLYAIFLLPVYSSFAAPPHRTAGSSAQPVNSVIQWNRNLLQIVRTPGAQSPTVHPTRSFAIMHAAIYDAVNAIDRTHRPYLVRLNGVP